MKKTLGQNGLNFIANKFKELKALVDKKVDKVNGKGLSTNDYDSTAKSKVDAIPANPKYTDTTYDLSKYAEKSDISRCKTKGYNTSSVWQALGTTRDLEDWIGDFDKRTRELKDNKGLTGASSEFKQQLIECNNARDIKLLAVRWGRIVQLHFYYVYNSNSSTTSFWEYTIPKEFMPANAHYGVMFHGDFEIFPKKDGSDARMTVRKEYGLNSGEIAGTVTYFAQHQ